MAGSLDSVSDLGLETQDRNLGETVNEQLPETGDTPAPVPGSDSFFGEGKFRFPKVLLEQGGSGILSNPMCHGMHEYLLSASVFDLNTSIEGVILFALNNSLQNQGENWPEILGGYSWYPRVLSDVGTAKREAYWQWIIKHEPADPDTCPPSGVGKQHCLSQQHKLFVM